MFNPFLVKHVMLLKFFNLENLLRLLFLLKQRL